MNFHLTRRKFFKALGIGSVAAMVAPAKTQAFFKNDDAFVNAVPEPEIADYNSARWDALCKGRNVVYAGRVSSRSEIDNTINMGDLVFILRRLLRNKARAFTGCLTKAQDGSLAPFYAVMGHTDLLKDLHGVINFIPTHLYKKQEKTFSDAEVGKLDYRALVLRFFLSSHFRPIERSGSVGTTFFSGMVAPKKPEPCDVYPMVIVARNAYGIAPVSIKDNQKRSFDWNTMPAKILNEDWLIRYEVAATT